TMATAALQSVFQSVDNISGSELRGRAASIIRGIIKEHDFKRGQRAVSLSQYRERLLHFETNANTKLEHLFSVQHNATHSADRLTATISIDDISTARIKAPKDTTHIKLVQLVGVLSDVVYNETLKKYEFTDVRLNRLSNVRFSDYIPLTQNEPMAVNLETTLNAAALTPTCSVMQAFGVIFFQKDKSLYYPSKETTAMQIVDVY